VSREPIRQASPTYIGSHITFPSTTAIFIVEWPTSLPERTRPNRTTSRRLSSRFTRDHRYRTFGLPPMNSIMLFTQPPAFCIMRNLAEGRRRAGQRNANRKLGRRAEFAARSGPATPIAQVENPRNRLVSSSREDIVWGKDSNEEDHRWGTERPLQVSHILPCSSTSAEPTPACSVSCDISSYPEPGTGLHIISFYSIPTG
jgi:hypothetical protein